LLLAAQAIMPIHAHVSVAWSVCLSVVCHIRAPCLNSSTDVDAVLDGGPWPKMEKNRFWGQTCS